MSAAMLEGFSEEYIAAPSNRKFGLTLGVLIASLAAGRWFLGHPGAVTTLLAVAGIGLAVTGAFTPFLLSALNRAWMKLGELMAAIVNPLIMLAMFALVFTPIAVVMRLRGRDVLQLRRGKTAASYWRSRQLEPRSLEQLKRQF